jgi:hypothetical protein
MRESLETDVCLIRWRAGAVPAVVLLILGVVFIGMDSGTGTDWPCPESTSVMLPRVEIEATCWSTWKRMV